MHRLSSILIIEDNPDGAETLQVLLQLHGFEVRVAGSGLEGIEAAVQWQPDIVLCDIGLPGGMDGWEVARRLRETPRTARARLLAITGYGSAEDLRRSKEAGFEQHLCKPVDPGELLRLLSRKSA